MLETLIGIAGLVLICAVTRLVLLIDRTIREGEKDVEKEG